MRIKPFAFARTGMVLVLGGITLVTLSGARGAPPSAIIAVLSSRPEVISGGNALIGVTVSAAAASNSLTIELNDTDVTTAFRPDASGRLVGLIGELRLGDNLIRVSGPGVRASELVLSNHPIVGPVLSGPREQPFYCMTNQFTLPASTQTLGAPIDADCSALTRVDYVYRTSGGQFKPLPTDGGRPGDLARTTTSDGKSVPYIVRVETGTINRAIYQTAILSDPATEHVITPFAPPSAWNHRLVYTLGGGCIGGWYIQGHAIGNGSILEDLMLRQGYGVASASLNVYGNNCNDLIAAETLSMVKERFLKTYGPVRFTIGVGCSGGSQQLHPIADEFPGLVDGIIVGCSFPEVLMAQITNQSDADLFAHYFTNSKAKWSPKEQAAATGYPNATTPANVGYYAIRIKAQGGSCVDQVPSSVRFDRATNPNGVRCDIYDHYADVLGRDPSTGAVRRPIDNVGVQYGLGALDEGAISVEQFLDLNRSIGGYDQDGNYRADRSVGDVTAIRHIYETGRVTYGGLGLRHTPIIDYRGYVDQPENSNEVHSRVHSFSLRERLLKVNGSFANHVMLVESGMPGTTGQFSDASPILSHALTQMDEWLTNLSAGSNVQPPTLAQIALAKPADLKDACFTDNGRVKIEELQVYRGDTACNRLYPAFAMPRLVAGEPLANNVLKCQLKPPDQHDYKVRFTASELAELKEIFPTGVCNYAVSGVGQVPTQGTWQIFSSPPH
jgi:Tannase-like family of unknown function (DUF6351)